MNDEIITKWNRIPDSHKCNNLSCRYCYPEDDDDDTE